MAIPQLSDDQVRTWTREQKDRWWLENVFRGNMPQLTLRAALTGFILGGLLSATNLYVGAKSGWTLGVGITSVIVAFAAFKVLGSLGLARNFTILENNAVQSVATAAGYMTGPLISGMAAYMIVQNAAIPWWQMMLFNVVLSILGVLVAFPMKRRFINDEQQPFPEGRACGVVLDTLYTSEAAVGMFKAKVLAKAALIAGTLKFFSGEYYMRFVQEKILGFKSLVFHLPDDFYNWMVNQKWLPVSRLAGVDVRQLGLSPTLDLAMFGAGGLMGIKPACSLLLGMVINFVIVVPMMISQGEILPKTGSIAAGTAVFTRAHVLNTWALWWGIAIMVTASLTGLFAKPKVIISAFRGVFAKRGEGEDVVGHIELPLKISFVGIPVVGAIGVWMAHDWFGVRWDLGAMAIPLIIGLTFIAANSTALTGTTPTGSLSKIPQFLFGWLDPKHPPTNLMTGVMCVEVASNASNLLMDIKPGYMLGAKPRQQAIGHCIGIVSGALFSTPLFYLLFMWNYKPGDDMGATLIQGQFGFPSAVQWKGVSDLVTSVFGGGKSPIAHSAVLSMVIAAGAGLTFEIARIFTRGKFPLSPLAIGLGVVVPCDSTMAMFAGAAFFWLMHRTYGSRPQSLGNRVWIQTHEPICAGIIAGAALVGIGDALLKVIAFK